MNVRILVGALSLVVLSVVVVVTFDEDVEDIAPSRTIVGDAPVVLPAGAEVGNPAEPPRSPSKSEAVREPEHARDWLRSYHASVDDFALARELLEPALLGDARAQYVLGQVLLRCEVYKRTLAPYAHGPVATRVELYLASEPPAPEQHRNQFRREAQRCARLFSETPFAGHGLPEQANDFRYWSELALESGDPLAVIDRAGRSMVSRPPTDDLERDRAFRAALMSDVRLAVSSRDPAALFAVGGIFSYPAFGADLEQGYAWQVVACELGYDCSTSNPDSASGCVEAGTCLAGFTHTDMLQRDLGATKYAQIYAKAQDIRYKVAVNDWEGLQQYLQVK